VCEVHVVDSMSKETAKEIFSTKHCDARALEKNIVWVKF